jgi:hypothetical protein
MARGALETLEAGRILAQTQPVTQFPSAKWSGFSLEQRPPAI